MKMFAHSSVLMGRSLVRVLRYSSDLGASRQVSMGESICSGCHVDGGPEALKQLPAGADVCEVEGAKVIKVSLPIFNAPECYGGACHVHSETESVLGIM